MSTESPPPARKPPSLKKALVIVVIVAFAAQFGTDLALFPWSVPLPGRPALAGDWYGEVLTPTGRRQYLALTLVATTGRCTAPCSRLKAGAQLCEPRIEREYDGLGTVENWRGSRFHVSLVPEETAPANSRAMRLDAAWDGEAVQGTLSFGAIANARAASASETPPDTRGDTERLFAVPVTLRRGAAKDFHQACRRL